MNIESSQSDLRRDARFIGTACITGATSGIGRVYAVELARRGWRLIVTGRRLAKLRELATEVEEIHRTRIGPATAAGHTDEKSRPAVEIITGDLADPAVCRRIADRLAACADLGLLIHNAGFGHNGRFFDLSPDDLRAMGEVHMQCAVELVRAAVPVLQAPTVPAGNRTSGPPDTPAEQRSVSAPAVILVSSVAAFIPAPGPAMYSTTKAFLVSFGKAIQPELARRGIRLQILCPGYTRTEFHDRLNWPAERRRNRGLIRWMDAGAVVNRSLAALGRRGPNGNPVFVPGVLNPILLILLRLVPRRLYARFAVRL